MIETLYAIEAVVIGEGKVKTVEEASSLKEAIVNLKIRYELFEHKTAIVTYAEKVTGDYSWGG